MIQRINSQKIINHRSLKLKLEANKKYSDPRTTPEEKARLKPLLSEVKIMFPQKLSEAEPSKNKS